MAKTKEQVLNRLLSELDIHPVLIDIGASGAPPEIWEPIAGQSIYVGFDPDSREMYEIPGGRFHRSIIVNEAVTNEEGSDELLFYLTRSPYCSSTLPPDLNSLSNFLLRDLFIVEREATVRAATLNSIMDRLSLPRIDWFKTDSQGIDLRLFNSLRDEIRSRVLAVDIEPGLVSGYQGEDKFIDIHRDLTASGFWLSDLRICGAVRMRRAALDEAMAGSKEINQAFVERNLKQTPAWCEARYLRTLEWLTEGDFEKRDFTLLWIFALLDGQLGFALDLVIEYERVFAGDAISRTMKDETISRIRKSRAKNPQRTMTLAARAKSLVPTRTKRWLKKMVRPA